MAEHVQMDAEAALRHADKAALLPWCPLDPAAALMAAEEGEDAGEMDSHGNVFDRVLAFLFVDGQPERWEGVALRALSLMRHCVPSVLVGRSFDEAAELRARGGPQSFRLTEFVEACALVPGYRDLLAGLLRYFFPDDGAWLAEGCRRVYLIARAYRPEYVQVWRNVGHQVKVRQTNQNGKTRVTNVRRETPEECESNYVEFARIFGEPVETAKDQKRARARWSARAQRVIARTIESGGGTMHLQFGKSASTRRLCAERAAGNQNRKAKPAGE